MVSKVPEPFSQNSLSRAKVISTLCVGVIECLFSFGQKLFSCMKNFGIAAYARILMGETDFVVSLKPLPKSSKRTVFVGV